MRWIVVDFIRTIRRGVGAARITLKTNLAKDDVVAAQVLTEECALSRPPRSAGGEIAF
jgi:hypothetical protein